MFLVVVGCHATGPAPAGDPFALPRYAGVTTCGPAVPPPPPSPEPRLPEREPVPSFVAPRTPLGDVSGGGLATSAIDDVMRRHVTRFRACFLHVAARGPGIDGIRVATSFTILEDGRVAGVEIRGVDAEMDLCLCDSLAGLVFDRVNARAHVAYPLIFGG